MNIIQTDFPGLKIIEPKVFGDSRGYFFESYNQKALSEAGIQTIFCQDNQSSSKYGVIRGLHFQKNPHAQTKLIRVLDGIIYDVVVDLRKGSPTFGKWMGTELSADNKRQLYIPGGFAHGFSVLSEQATIMYKCDQFYHPASEGGIIYNDPELNIDWKVDMNRATISDKDRSLPELSKIDSDFTFE
ncbi:MAG: dTDP-4-dehydrorhamnose 3,5-epimerase [Bacteroidales bacterium]|jgi:dTDP-4-dehydrorhamnose 3,5-epimerase|nr:dTDP-4-dehydrorhamnose 3,5-epimerase [Bacteroidales bacterium]